MIRKSGYGETSFGKELIESAREALSIAEGKLKPGAVHIPGEIDDAAVRSHFGLSQKS